MNERFDYIWFWKGNSQRPIFRKGEACRVKTRGKMNSVLVEFKDGYCVVTSRFAVRKLKGLI